MLEIPNGAIQIAESFVKDWANGLIECDMNENMPGLFYVAGEFDSEGIKKNFSKELKKAEQRQKNWFNLLVKAADSDWAKTNGSPRSVSDLQRMAAQELGLTDRDWMKSTVDNNKVKCVACGSLRNPAFPVCGVCNRVVDAELAKKLGILETATR